MRHYKRLVGSRSYRTSYTQQALRKATDSCKSGRMSIRKASRHFGIPYGTLVNKVTGKHTAKAGGQKRLSDDAESHLVKAIDHLAEWKVPLCARDIRLQCW